MILDIIFAVALVAFLILGICRGAAKTLLSVLSVIGAAVLSALLSQFLAEFFFNMFIRQSLVNDINTVLKDSFAGDATLTAAAILATLPSFALSAMNYFGVPNSSIENYCADAITSKTDDVAETIVDAIMPSVTGFLATVVSIILFVVLLLIFRWLSKALAKVFRLPLIRTVDSVLGAIIGLLEGVFVIFVTVSLINLLLPLFSGEWVSQFESYMDSSYIFSLINRGDIFTWIQLFTYKVDKLINI